MTNSIPTDPETMKEIKEAFTTEKIDEKPRGLKQLFTRDELLPMKGVWFRALEVEEERLVLVPMHFTRNFAKRRGRDF